MLRTLLGGEQSAIKAIVTNELCDLLLSISGRTAAKKKYIGVRMMTLTPAYVTLTDETPCMCR